VDHRPSGLVLPSGVEYAASPPPGQSLERGLIVNETDLPDGEVQHAVETYFDEHASMLGVNLGRSQFQHYATGSGSLLARRKFATPTNVFDEIALARNLAERDDDIGAVLGSMMAIAFGDGMQHTHRDEVVQAVYDEIAEHSDLDATFEELYLEFLIANQFTTMTAWTQETFQFQPDGSDRQRSRDVVSPLIGVLPSEQLRVVGNDVFKTGVLAYKPVSASQEAWLSEFFNPRTSAARKAAMRREDPVLTTLLVDELEDEDGSVSSFFWDGRDRPATRKIYRFNPRLVARTTGPKGGAKYPRPMMTRNFALLEAKRLLNLMDYALLQGGCNFLVVAKKGSDQRPALPEEVANLREQVSHASESGVLIGDHRLSIEIITPKLDELLNESKRKLLGRKMAMSIMRIGEFASENPAAEGMRAEIEILARVITRDRLKIRRHVQSRIYREVERRNATVLGRARIQFPKIVLQGTQAFTDYVLKLRDRGDIPRSWAIEAAGYDPDAAVAQRKREKAQGIDRVLTPAPVPFSAGGPQDNGGGRPPGASPNNGAPGARAGIGPDRARPTRVIQRNAGETVRAFVEEDGSTYRAGELTHSILEEYADSIDEAVRLTAIERRMVEQLAADEWPEIATEGPTAVVPVNPDYEIENVKAVALAPGLRILVGSDVETGALMARAFSFKEPWFKRIDAEERAITWGFRARPELEESTEPDS
jgi:ribosomal protein L17